MAGGTPCARITAQGPNKWPPTPGTRILCPALGQELLAEDNGLEGAPVCKGQKFNELLRRSLTASSGADWARMRPAVERAMGGGLAAQRKRHERACAACAELAGELASVAGPLDARGLASVCAARGMAVAAAGGGHEELEAALGAFFREDLLAHHADAAAKARLLASTTRLIEREQAGEPHYYYYYYHYYYYYYYCYYYYY